MATKEKVQRVGVVPRGTIVQLAKTMLRDKIVACERAVRDGKYSRGKTDDAKVPPAVRANARRIKGLQTQVDAAKKQLRASGFEVTYSGRIERASHIRAEEENAARAQRYAQLHAARTLREQTLIALVGAANVSEAADILRGLRAKLDAI